MATELIEKIDYFLINSFKGKVKVTLISYLAF